MKKTCVVCGRFFAYQPRRGRPPLTCSPKCQEARNKRKEQESRRRRGKKECPPEAHGTSTGYTIYKCDCTKCSRWARLYQQGYRKRQRQ